MVNSNSAPNYSEQLQTWMAAAKLSSFRALAQRSGVSRRQIERLRKGEAHSLSIGHAVQLADALGMTLGQLLQQFGPGVDRALLERLAPTPSQASEPSALAAVQSEYQRLQAEMEVLTGQLQTQFQAETLNVLEPLMVQWPTAAYAAQKNPAAPAIRLLPLLKPLEQLLANWHIEPIGSVGQVVPYAPQLHQWMGETTPPQADRPVQVSHVGYRQGDKLLYRARVRLPVPGAL